MSSEEGKSLESFFVLLEKKLRENAKVTNLEARINARVPVLCFSFENEGKKISFDVVNQRGKERKHQIQITEYVLSLKKSCHFETVARIIKIWAKKKRINEARENTLPSIAYLVMLQNVVEEEKEYVDKLSSIEKKSHLISSYLLLSFFNKFSFWPTSQIVRTRDCVGSENSDLLFKIGEKQDIHNEGFGVTLFVQDPFLEEINLARFVTTSSFQTKIKPSFEEAVEILFESKNGERIKRLLL